MLLLLLNFGVRILKLTTRSIVSWHGGGRDLEEVLSSLSLSSIQFLAEEEEMERSPLNESPSIPNAFTHNEPDELADIHCRDLNLQCCTTNIIDSCRCGPKTRKHMCWPGQMSQMRCKQLLCFDGQQSECRSALAHLVKRGDYGEWHRDMPCGRSHHVTMVIDCCTRCCRVRISVNLLPILLCET